MREMNVPATVTTTFQGTAQAFQESLKNTWVLLGVAILVIYLVLGFFMRAIFTDHDSFRLAFRRLGRILDPDVCSERN